MLNSFINNRDFSLFLISCDANLEFSAMMNSTSMTICDGLLLSPPGSTQVQQTMTLIGLQRWPVCIHILYCSIIEIFFTIALYLEQPFVPIYGKSQIPHINPKISFGVRLFCKFQNNDNNVGKIIR